MFAETKRKAHEAIDVFFKELESALGRPSTSVKRRSSIPPILAEDAPEGHALEGAIVMALAVEGRRAPQEQVRLVNERDRQIVLEVRRRTSDEDWPNVSRRLQANLKLVRQQVAGIVAAAKRNGKHAA